MSEDTDQDLACAGIDIGKDVQQENMTSTPEMPMTPEERAEKTIRLISAYLGQPPHELPFSDGKQTHEIIAAQIREAEEEAFNLGRVKGLDIGFNAAKEKAVKIALDYSTYHLWPREQSKDVADRIRQMGAE